MIEFEGMLFDVVSRHLSHAGYSPVPSERCGLWPAPQPSVWEDRFGIVAVIAYMSQSELLSLWTQAQDALVRLISENLDAGEPKSFEGYLALFCVEPVPQEKMPAFDAISSDTRFVRKLVGVSSEGIDEELVKDTLRSVLPIARTGVMDRSADPFQHHVNAVADGIAPHALWHAVIESRRQRQPLMKAIEDHILEPES